MSILVRTAGPGDAPVIAEYNAAMARETEDRVLDPDRLAAGVEALFADPGKGFYLVAERAGVVVGQLLITFEWSDWRNGNFWWLQSVYVHPDHRRQGVFAALFNHARQAARSRPDVCGLRLYVDAENTRAKRAYEKLGLRPSRYELLELDFVLNSKN